MDRSGLLTFMRREQYAVLASVSASGEPQAALVGIVVTDAFEIFFDTLATSRKAKNLRTVPMAALVVGPAGSASEQTVQYEGIADEPSGLELENLLDIYFARFPDGRARRNWTDIAYFRVKPKWIRYSDYSVDSPQILEFGVNKFFD